MKHLLILSMLCLFLSTCTKEEICPSSEELDLFDELWLSFSQEYAAFEVLGIDWNRVRDTYRPQVTAATSPDSLLEVFRVMLYELKDAHADLQTYSKLGAINYYYEVTNEAPNNYIGWDHIRINYLEQLIEKNSQLAYGKIRNTEIGYLKLATFSGTSEDFDVALRLLTDFDNLNGVIIDVRNNGGGNELNAQLIAGRFTDQTTTYRYTKYKEGCQRNKLSDFKTLKLDPVGPEQFLGKVILLTNKKTFSAGEDFTLMMKALPNVYHIGDHTWGGFATGPTQKTLSNGWGYRVSRNINYDLSKTPFVGGIAPDERVIISVEDEINEEDVVLEKAISLLN
ncbi:MAG: S41 family peptidase [Bacteroidota bacterium]